MSGALRFQSVSDAGCERWSWPKRLDFLERLPTAPVGDSEILHLSHYCPIVVIQSADGPRVAILLDPALLRSNPLGKDGRWRAPYSPMALRSLPFWPGSSASEIEIALELVADDSEASLPMRDKAGQPTHAFAAVVTLIGQLQQGIRRLTEAAKILMAADVLVPLVIEEAGREPVETAYLTVGATRLAAMTPGRAASLSMDHCTPLDLAAACLFSQRLLARRVKPLRTERRAAAGPVADAGMSEHFEAHMRVDSSPLFSFELFERLGAEGRGAEGLGEMTDAGA
jgi:hypothetical protein